MLTAKNISSSFRSLQDQVCIGLEQLDGKALFTEDLWNREGGGGGRTRVIQNGNVFEKGGVNFSAVHGPAPSVLLKENEPAGKNFFATGVSIVIHPTSPMVPVIHMNVRYLELGDVKWFGGGIDLTPVYVEKEITKYFHLTLRGVCDKFDKEYYPSFKKWADDYFYIQHRKETRGSGGIFFDQLKPDNRTSIDQLFDFVLAVGESFIPLYSRIVNDCRNRKYGERQKLWQLLRRGRYAEFNLVYDRGTRFGLETDGRTESILMSLPPMASWIYNFIPEPGSDEELTLNMLRKGVDWINKK